MKLLNCTLYTRQKLIGVRLRTELEKIETNLQVRHDRSDSKALAGFLLNLVVQFMFTQYRLTPNSDYWQVFASRNKWTGNSQEILTFLVFQFPGKSIHESQKELQSTCEVRSLNYTARFCYNAVTEVCGPIPHYMVNSLS